MPKLTYIRGNVALRLADWQATGSRLDIHQDYVCYSMRGTRYCQFYKYIYQRLSLYCERDQNQTYTIPTHIVTMTVARLIFTHDLCQPSHFTYSCSNSLSMVEKVKFISHLLLNQSSKSIENIEYFNTISNLCFIIFTFMIEKQY